VLSTGITARHVKDCFVEVDYCANERRDWSRLKHQLVTDRQTPGHSIYQAMQMCCVVKIAQECIC